MTELNVIAQLKEWLRLKKEKKNIGNYYYYIILHFLYCIPTNI